MKLEHLREVLQQDKHIVIAIDGPSGSGKSTLSSYLQEQYDCLVFHTDDYFLHPDRKTKERLNEPGGNLDYERMEQEVFHHLNENHITSNHFNCLTNTLEYREPYKSKKIIIIEGVYSMHPNFLQYYDYTVFLSIDRNEQYERILSRSNEFMLNRFKTEWIPLEDLYFTTFSIQEKADFVLDSTINFREFL